MKNFLGKFSCKKKYLGVFFCEFEKKWEKSFSGEVEKIKKNSNEFL